MKNKLENIERKIQEYRNISSLEQRNEAMEQYNRQNVNDILWNNIDALNAQRVKDEHT